MNMDIRKASAEGNNRFQHHGSDGLVIEFDYIKYYDGASPVLPETWKDTCVMKFEGFERAKVAFTLGPFSNGYVVDVEVGDWVIHQSPLQGFVFSCFLFSTFFLRGGRADTPCGVSYRREQVECECTERERA
jgi:hypothetical protein